MPCFPSTKQMCTPDSSLASPSLQQPAASPQLNWECRQDRSCPGQMAFSLDLTSALAAALRGERAVLSDLESKAGLHLLEAAAVAVRAQANRKQMLPLGLMPALAQIMRVSPDIHAGKAYHWVQLRQLCLACWVRGAACTRPKPPAAPAGDLQHAVAASVHRHCSMHTWPTRDACKDNVYSLHLVSGGVRFKGTSSQQSAACSYHSIVLLLLQDVLARLNTMAAVIGVRTTLQQHHVTTQLWFLQKVLFRTVATVEALVGCSLRHVAGHSLGLMEPYMQGRKLACSRAGREPGRHRMGVT